MIIPKELLDHYNRLDGLREKEIDHIEWKARQKQQQYADYMISRLDSLFESAEKNAIVHHDNKGILEEILKSYFDKIVFTVKEYSIRMINAENNILKEIAFHELDIAHERKRSLEDYINEKELNLDAFYDLEDEY